MSTRIVAVPLFGLVNKEEKSPISPSVQEFSQHLTDFELVHNHFLPRLEKEASK